MFKGRMGIGKSKKQIAPMNCLKLVMKDGKAVKIWLEMDIRDKCTYCVLHTNISDKIYRIDIDAEMGKYIEEIKLVEWAE